MWLAPPSPFLSPLFIHILLPPSLSGAAGNFLCPASSLSSNGFKTGWLMSLHSFIEHEHAVPITLTSALCTLTSSFYDM